MDTVDVLLIVVYHRNGGEEEQSWSTRLGTGDEGICRSGYRDVCTGTGVGEKSTLAVVWLGTGDDGIGRSGYQDDSSGSGVKKSHV